MIDGELELLAITEDTTLAKTDIILENCKTTSGKIV